MRSLVEIISAADIQLRDILRNYISKGFGLTMVVGTSLQKKKSIFSKLSDFISFPNLKINLGKMISESLIRNEINSKFFDLDEFLINYVQNEKVLFIDHIEILSDSYLQLDPIHCLLNIARKHVIIANIPGLFYKDYLDYGPKVHRYGLDYFNVPVLIIKVE